MAENQNARLIKEEVSSSFSSGVGKDFYSVADSIDEFFKPCSRFASPLSFIEKFELHIAKMLSRLNVFQSMAVIPRHTIPPNWQMLLNYLYRQGVIAEPAFSYPQQRNDFARFNKATLTSKFDRSTTDARDIGKHVRGQGTSIHPEEAYSKAVGELLERYALTLYKKKDFLHGSYNSLLRQGKKVIDLNDLPGFLPWQKEKFSQFQYDANTVLNWVRVPELISGKNVYIPAQLLFWTYDFGAHPTEPRLKELNTNGQAGGFTFEESITSAIYENVERDAFLIFWLNTLSAPVLDMSQSEGGELRDFISLIERYGIKLYVLDTTTDIEIPSCACVLLDERGDAPRVTVGASSGFNITRNIISATIEALGSAVFFDTKFELPEAYEPFTAAEIGQHERVWVWEGRNMLEKFNFFISGARTPLHESAFGKLSRTFGSAQEEYNHVLNIFKQKGKGYELYAYTVKHPILKKIGYRVTKIVIPKLIPMYLKEHMATLDSVRLREVPQKLGYKNTKLNPWPHPFP